MDISLNRITSWKYPDVKNFINGNSALEGHQHDFKEIIELDNEKIRKLFCAFANSEGGLLIFGVDNSIKIVGVDRNTELQTRLSNVLLTGILPLINSNNWHVYEYEIPRKNKYVYVVAIKPSAHYDRPHIFSQKIYVRNNGTCDPLQDGREIRAKYLRETFFPEDICSLEGHLDKLKNCRFAPDAIDFMYLPQLRKFLESQLQQGEENPNVIDLLRDYDVLIKLYEEIKNKINLSAVTGETVSVFGTDSMVSAQKALSEKIELFMKNFKEVYGI